MTPARHQRVRCPLPPTTVVCLLPVTKGHCSAWPSGGRWLPGQQEEEGSAVPAGASSLCLLCGPSRWIPSPYLSCAGAKGDAGPHKELGCQHPAGTCHCLGDPLHPMAPLPHDSAREPDPHRSAGPCRGAGKAAGPSPRPLPPDLAVTRAQPRHSPLCGSSLLALKGKSTREGAAAPRLEHSSPARG